LTDLGLSTAGGGCAGDLETRGQGAVYVGLRLLTVVERLEGKGSFGFLVLCSWKARDLVKFLDKGIHSTALILLPERVLVFLGEGGQGAAQVKNAVPLSFGEAVEGEFRVLGSWCLVLGSWKARDLVKFLDKGIHSAALILLPERVSGF
jgi:hypothetical protein